jgi:hypothetical protein
MNRPPAEASDPARETGELDAMIDELLTSSAELARAAYENVKLLAELVAARAATAERAHAPPADSGSGPLGPDLLETARLQAQAAGVSVEQYVRDAVLAYVAPAAPASARGDGGGAGARRRRR